MKRKLAKKLQLKAMKFRLTNQKTMTRSSQSTLRSSITMRSKCIQMKMGISFLQIRSRSMKMATTSLQENTKKNLKIQPSTQMQMNRQNTSMRATRLALAKSSTKKMTTSLLLKMAKRRMTSSSRVRSKKRSLISKKAWKQFRKIIKSKRWERVRSKTN